MEEFFVALVPITFILSVAGVLIFRPLTKRLGSILEANAVNRHEAQQERVYHEHLRALLDAQSLKIEQLEQRLEFAEGFLETRAARLLSHQSSGRPEPG